MHAIRNGFLSIVCVWALPAVVAASLSSAAVAQDAGCAAAVNRVRNALTWEGYFLKNATQVDCQLAALPPESREGKAQAMSEAAQQNLKNAQRETTDAYAAAGSCDVSGERRPELIVPKVDFNLYSACELKARGIEQEATMRARWDDKAAHAAAYARYEAARESCRRLLEEVDCAAIRIKDDDAPSVTLIPVATVPDDVAPRCRTAYLRLAAAQSELDRTQKYADSLRTKISGTGPRGYEMYKSAMANWDRARQASDRAKDDLLACEGKTEAAGMPKPGTPKPMQACDAGARAAFARMSGSWKSISMGPNITIGGSCEEAAATEHWAEYCERPDATYNSTLARYKATFIGKVEGASLSLGPAPNSTDTRSGSCSVNADGTLSCTGIPCGIHATKQ